MKSFSITIDNGHRRQEFTQEYGNEGYARLSLYHVMSNMLDSAIKESFGQNSSGNIPNWCPKCEVNLEGAEIPMKDRVAFGGRERFSRIIFVTNVKPNKCVCPDCGHEWQLTQPTKELMSETSIND